MKNSLLVLLLVVQTIGAAAQELPKNEEGKIVYEEVIQVEGATKNQLYRQARKWFAETYEDGQDEDVVYLKDSYLGEIGANPFLWMEVTPTGKTITAGAILYEVKVSVKDGRYKYKFFNFSHESQGTRLGTAGALENTEPECGTLNMRQEYWDEIKTQTNEKILELITGLKERMTEAATATSEDDDW